MGRIASGGELSRLVLALRLAAGVGEAEGLRLMGGGSRHSMSPQQLAGEPPQPADDIYAFGALMIHKWPSTSGNYTGAEITGIIVTDSDDVLFNVQHPSAMSKFPYNRGVVGIVNGYNTSEDFKPVPVPKGDAILDVVVAKGEYQVLARVGEEIQRFCVFHPDTGFHQQGKPFVGDLIDEIIAEKLEMGSHPMPPFNWPIAFG